MRIIGRESWRVEANRTAPNPLPFPFSGFSCPGCGNFANMGTPWRCRSYHSYGTRSVGCRSHVSRAKPPVVACGLRRLCVHGKISISSGPRLGEGQVTRQAAGDPTTTTVVFPSSSVARSQARGGGQCGPQALILSDTPPPPPPRVRISKSQLGRSPKGLN